MNYFFPPLIRFNLCLPVTSTIRRVPLPQQDAVRALVFPLWADLRTRQEPQRNRSRNWSALPAFSLFLSFFYLFPQNGNRTRTDRNFHSTDQLTTTGTVNSALLTPASSPLCQISAETRQRRNGSPAHKRFPRRPQRRPE